MSSRFGPSPTGKPQNFGQTIRRLLSHLGGERVRIAVVLLLTVLSVSLGVLGPKFLGDGTNVIFEGVAARMIPSGMTKEQFVVQLKNDGRSDLASLIERLTIPDVPGIDYPALAKILAIVLAVYLLSVVFQFIAGLILRTVVQNVGWRLRTDVQAKLDRLPLSYLDQHRRGDLMSRMTNDIDNVTQTLQQTVSRIFDAILTVIGVLIMMLWISWSLALLALITVPLGAVVATVIARKARPHFRNRWAATGDLGGVVEEAYTGHQVVQAFGLGDEFLAEFDQENDRLYHSSVRAEAISMLMQPAMMLVSNLSYIIVAVAGGLQVATGRISLGAVQAFIQYSRQFSQPLQQIAAMANLLQSGAASAERIFTLLDAAELDDDAPPSATAVSFDGASINFDHVKFGYLPQTPVIHDLTLDVSAGQMVAIIGPTGAGKTTLVNLLMRFYEVDDGAIRIDGRDIRDINKQDLRSRIGMVLQDTWLFHGTISDNIAYGARGSATQDEIVAAAIEAQADRFIRQLPAGYDTIISEDASNLSSGEQQLLTIARAFIANPEILILDEATSSVDTRTERVIQDAMEKLRQGRTSFVIAHRLSTIRDADTILVLEDGDVVEQGNHTELLKANGAYARLYRAQFAGQ